MGAARSGAGKTSTQQIRDWHGPAVLSFGFRPFFLLAALWSALSMALWIGFLNGLIAHAPDDPVAWHAHTFLIGYFGAVVSGFLLTAVPNWTGRLPITGWPLAALALLWVIGRVAMFGLGTLPTLLIALLDLSSLIALIAMLGREVIAGRNWKNLPVLSLLLLLILAGLCFHLDIAAGRDAAQGLGARIMLGVAVMMIALIGGRILPAFTRNWLAQQSDPVHPTPPMQTFDKISLGLLAAALLAWCAAPEHPITAALLLLAGTAHALRLARWRADRTLAEPLLWILHIAYAFLPLGTLAMGLATISDTMTQASAQHLWMAGGIGLMTIAVMSRATLGHTGRALTAGPGTTLIYLLLIGAVLLRVAGGWMGAAQSAAYLLSGLCWIGGFLGFALLYGPLLLRARKI